MKKRKYYIQYYYLDESPRDAGYYIYGLNERNDGPIGPFQTEKEAFERAVEIANSNEDETVKKCLDRAIKLVGEKIYPGLSLNTIHKQDISAKHGSVVSTILNFLLQQENNNGSD